MDQAIRFPDAQPILTSAARRPGLLAGIAIVGLWELIPSLIPRAACGVLPRVWRDANLTSCGP